MVEIKTVGKYKFEKGCFLEFVIDDNVAKDYGLEKTLKLFASATDDFVKCSDLSYSVKNTKDHKIQEEKPKLKKLLMKDNTKGLEKIKKANMVIKEVRKRTKDTVKLKKLHLSHAEEFREKVRALDLSPNERKVIEEEYTKTSRIFETEGIMGIIERLKVQFTKLEDVLSDPVKAWKHHSPSVGGVIVAIICIFLVFGGLVAAIITYPRRPRFLGNTNTSEIHDLNNHKMECKTSYIKPEHIVYFKTLGEAEEAIRTQGFNGCFWCMREYHTD